MNSLDLIKRNTIEVVKEAELEGLPSDATVYCGYETSGPVHIGTMVTVNKLLDFQEAGLKVKVLFADVHTKLNRKGADDDWIDGMVSYWEKCFKALGLSDAEYVRGSSFQFEADYMQDVLSLGVATTMNRALRSMQEVARDIDNAHVSQVIYPLMQAIDIKALKADIAYGGIEQRKIHMLAREALADLGYKKPVCIHTPLLCSIKGPDSKMSSSVPESIIAVEEEPDSIRKKIKTAYCPPEKDENPILDMAKLLILPRTGKVSVKRPEKFGGDVEYKTYEEIEKDYVEKKLHPADLKTAVAEHLIEILEPVRKAVG
ncbi:tyrosine--tRNA ligase [Candidatus Altiarchaeota archaeon]